MRVLIFCSIVREGELSMLVSAVVVPLVSIVVTAAVRLEAESTLVTSSEVWREVLSLLCLEMLVVIDNFSLSAIIVEA